jgi:hypothetical protein
LLLLGSSSLEQDESVVLAFGESAAARKDGQHLGTTFVDHEKEVPENITRGAIKECVPTGMKPEAFRGSAHQEIREVARAHFSCCRLKKVLL